MWIYSPLDAWTVCCAGASGCHQAVWSARDPAHATGGEERTNLTALQSQSHCHLQPLPSMYHIVCVYGCVSMYIHVLVNLHGYDYTLQNSYTFMHFCLYVSPHMSGIIVEQFVRIWGLGSVCACIAG